MKIQIGNDIRDMTAEEQAQYQNVLQDQQIVVEQINAAQTAKISAQQKLVALGLTEAEIAALVGA